MRRLCFAAAIIGLAACDAVEPLEPTNIYDPASGDARVPVPPANVRVQAATPNSITIAWDDRSSFERGFRIVEIPVEVYEMPRTVATVPPDTETYTIDLSPSERVHRFTVRAIAPTINVETAGNEVAVRYPYERTRLPSAPFRAPRIGYESVLSRDLQTLYMPVEAAVLNDPTRIRVFDIQAGTELYTTVRTAFPMRLSLGGMAFVTQHRHRAPETERAVDMSWSSISRAGEGPEVSIQLSRSSVDARFECFANSDEPVVSEDGRRLAVACEGPKGLPWIWDLEAGVPIPIPGPVRNTWDEGLVALSPTGDRLLTAQDGYTKLYELSTGQALWTRLGYPSFGQFSPDGSMILTSGYGLGVWDASTGAQRAFREYITETQYESVVGNRAAVSLGQWNRRSRIEIVDLDDLRVSHAFQVSGLERAEGATGYAPSAHILRARLDENGLSMVTADGLLRRWDFTRAWEVAPPNS